MHRRRRPRRRPHHRTQTRRPEHQTKPSQYMQNADAIKLAGIELPRPVPHLAATRHGPRAHLPRRRAGSARTAAGVWPRRQRRRSSSGGRRPSGGSRRGQSARSRRRRSGTGSRRSSTASSRRARTRQSQVATPLLLGRCLAEPRCVRANDLRGAQLVVLLALVHQRHDPVLSIRWQPRRTQQEQQQRIRLRR